MLLNNCHCCCCCCCCCCCILHLWNPGKLNTSVSLTSLPYSTMKHDIIRGGPRFQVEFLNVASNLQIWYCCLTRTFIFPLLVEQWVILIYQFFVQIQHWPFIPRYIKGVFCKRNFKCRLGPTRIYIRRYFTFTLMQSVSMAINQNKLGSYTLYFLRVKM